MRYVLVTGASTGIGLAIVEYFIEKGFYVFGSVRTTADSERLTSLFGERVIPLVFDVTDAHSIQSAYLLAADLIGEKPFIGIINNAGIVVKGPLMHIPIEEFEYQMNVNVYGLLRVTQIFFPLLKRLEPGFEGIKKIINIGSVSGLFAGPFVGPYAASKYAVEAITDSLRRELLIYDHLDVVVIEPGAIATPIWEKAKAENDDFYKNTEYWPIIQKKNKIIDERERTAIPPREVAKVAYEMLTNKTKATHRLVMKNSWLFKLVKNWIPARIIDRSIKKRFRKGI